MKLNIVVLMKQVPDTRVVSCSTILPDGTINRKALPTIINPNDLQALEMALGVKDAYPESCVTVVSMGPGAAKEVIKEAMYRGADKGVLLSDAVFAGSDTLATSRILASAIQKIGGVDCVFCGRQTIDGDTAHVGPQVAQWLGISQVTAVTSMNFVSDEICQLSRLGDAVEETVEAALPLLVTVDESAEACRFRQAKRVMSYKNEAVPVWDAAQLGIEATQCGLGGSATQVVTSKPVDLSVKESCVIENNKESIETWFSELLNTCIIA
jgi:electron transfer flavoprotein beta subunit